MMPDGTIIVIKRSFLNRIASAASRCLYFLYVLVDHVELLNPFCRKRYLSLALQPLAREREIYLLQHIPKTGGTSIANQLARYLRPEEMVLVYPNVDSRLINPQGVREYFRKLSRTQKDVIRVVMGHVAGYFVEDAFQCSFRKICFLRRPVDYAISLYYHVVRFHRLCEAGKVPGLDYRRSNRLYRITNADGRLLSFEDWYTKYADIIRIAQPLANYHFRFKRKAGPRKMLEMAKRVLDRFYFVGITENPEDFLIVFKLLGVPGEYRIENTGDYPVISDERMKAITAFVQNKTPYEQALYEYALQLNRKFKNSMPASCR